jgi:hypothetical protein
VSSRLTSGFRRVGMLANSTKPLLDVSLQKLGLPLRTHSGRRGQHPQWWWHRGPLELRAGKVLNHTAKELKDQLSRLSEKVASTNGSRGGSCRSLSSFLGSNSCSGGGLAALGDGDGVVGDFRAADACWPPGVDDAQRVCTSVVSAWLIRARRRSGSGEVGIGAA